MQALHFRITSNDYLETSSLIANVYMYYIWLCNIVLFKEYSPNIDCIDFFFFLSSSSPCHILLAHSFHKSLSSYLVYPAVTFSFLWGPPISQTVHPSVCFCLFHRGHFSSLSRLQQYRTYLTSAGKDDGIDSDSLLYLSISIEVKILRLFEKVNAIVR